MSRLQYKKWLRRKAMFNPAVWNQFEIDGEPLIYTIKYDVGLRTRGANFFRNKEYYSFLRCFYPAYRKSKIPVAILVTFYVSPLSNADITKEDLKSEKIPAVFSYEILDYVISFLEVFHGVLIESYCQICTMQIAKFYSRKPRTVFQFMKWSDYVKLQTDGPVHAGTKKKRSVRKRRSLQPEPQRDGQSEGLSAPDSTQRLASADGSPAGDYPSSPSDIQIDKPQDTRCP